MLNYCHRYQGDQWVQKDWYLSVICFWHFRAPPMTKTWTSRGTYLVKLCLDSGPVPPCPDLLWHSRFLSLTSAHRVRCLYQPPWNYTEDMTIYSAHVMWSWKPFRTSIICDYHQSFVYAPIDIPVSRHSQHIALHARIKFECNKKSNTLISWNQSYHLWLKQNPHEFAYCIEE